MDAVELEPDLGAEASISARFGASSLESTMPGFEAGT
jgi:hypothetical protein